jgi:hypothetical protein
MSLNESIVEDTALDWLGEIAGSRIERRLSP